MAGLKYTPQDLQSLVWISKYEGMQISQRYELPNDEVSMIGKCWLRVIPVFSNNY